MRGDRVSGGYEAGFAMSERLRDAMVARLHAIPHKVTRSTGFAGAKGYRIVAPNKRLLPDVERLADAATRDVFKVGDRVRTLAPLHRWMARDQYPVGTLATVTKVESGGLYVVFDADPTEVIVGSQWFDLA